MENFIYMNESTIDENLKCDICKKPFIDPISLPCEETFCLKCIQSNIQNHSNNCSQCNRRTLTDKDFITAGRPIRKMVDNLLVKCSLCDLKNMQRGNFKKHIELACPKRIVFCHANDIKCQWNGPYDQLDQHVNKCPYQQIRTDLTQLINDNKHLKQLLMNFHDLQNYSKKQQNIIEQIQTENNRLTEQSNQQLNEINQLIDQNRTLNKQINQIEQAQLENQHLNERSEQQLDEINKLKNENQLLNEEIDKMKQCEIKNESLIEESSQQLNQINHLKLEYKSIEDQCNQYKFQIDQYENSFKDFCETFQDKQNYFDLIQSDNENLRQYLQEQQIQIDSYQKENQHVQTDYQNFHPQYQQQQTEIQSLIQLNQQLNQQITDLEHIQRDNQQLKQQSIQYQLQIEQLIINIKRLESKLNKPIFQSKELCDDNNNNELKELIDQCQSNSLINLTGETINDNDIEIVINIGLINKQCQSIILSQNNLTSNSLLRLSSYLNINKTLTRLIISNNYLSDLSIKYLSESLSFNNSTLKHLILSSNKINDQGFIYLSDMFKSNQTIIVFGLQDNQITDKSIEYFCKIIQFYNKVIQEISLYSNKLITDLSIQPIYDMITNNNSLNTFWIWDCQLSKQGIDQLQQSIQTKIDFDLRFV